MAKKTTKPKQTHAQELPSPADPARIARFVSDFSRARYERGQAQAFCIAFLQIFGIGLDEIISCEALEHRIKHRNGETMRLEQCYIDAYIPNKIIIEMKSANVSNMTAAFEQIRKYYDDLPRGEKPRLRMICDFETIYLRDTEYNTDARFPVAELQQNAWRFNCLAGAETPRVEREQTELCIEASNKMAQIYTALQNVGFGGQDLMKFMVRLLFCLFAEDTQIFPFYSFTTIAEMSNPDGSDLKSRLADLFEVLNTPKDKRIMVRDELKQFPYVNGRLFEDGGRMPAFDNCFFKSELKRGRDGKPINPVRAALLDCCYFDWRNISPDIFGAMFQGVMDDKARREGGVHYTSRENILKVINPLFMDGLRAQWKEICHSRDTNRYAAFQNKLSTLQFLDPACGCGNFLMVAYEELRRLENEVIEALLKTDKKHAVGAPQQTMIGACATKVSVAQFHGIEILPFPCLVAQVSMWLTEYNMDYDLRKRLPNVYIAPYLPLSSHADITCANALRCNWNDLLPQGKRFDYIFGNPPFNGRRYRTKEQIQDVAVFFKYKDIDYVACWYEKATQYMTSSPTTETAFVSTNSISQGEQVNALWQPIINNRNMVINFAYRTFKWSNEAKSNANVYCVVIGFSDISRDEKFIVSSSKEVLRVKHINPYLIESETDCFITVRTSPIFAVPHMQNGNVPLDGDALKIDEKDYDDFKTCPWVKRLIGGNELINNKKRYVLWLVDATPSQLRKHPRVLQRIDLCRQNRLNMKDASTRKLADFPTRFRDNNNPDNYLGIPLVSSERREYIPMAFFDKSAIPTNQIQTLPEATIYHFGILTSRVHMAWMRTVAGRLKSDYRYSKDIVYNNFIWPAFEGESAPKGCEKFFVAPASLKQKIEAAAQQVLDARAQYPDSSLADLYDPLSMPPDLLRAHRALDDLVCKAYGYAKNATEQEIVADLFLRYEAAVGHDQ